MVSVMPADRVVVFVVFDGMKLLDVAGPAEVFAEANHFGASYRVVMASVDGQDVVTSVGTRIGRRDVDRFGRVADTVSGFRR